VSETPLPPEPTEATDAAPVTEAAGPTAAVAAQASESVPGSAQTEPDRSGIIVVIDPSGLQRTLVVPLGQRVFVGGDPSATIQVAHPRVVARQAIISREGPGWLVTSLDPANPIWMLDETGRAIPVMEEVGFRSATLVAGTTQILLYPPMA
jgi:hypothetical protein